MQERNGDKSQSKMPGPLIINPQKPETGNTSANLQEQSSSKDFAIAYNQLQNRLIKQEISGKQSNSKLKHLVSNQQVDDYIKVSYIRKYAIVIIGCCRIRTRLLPLIRILLRDCTKKGRLT
jgi:S-methylmethionine-dependent homocysteine/selenocysteine methylase